MKDPVLSEGSQWGYQALQPWQDEVIRKCEASVALLQQKMAAKQ